MKNIDASMLTRVWQGLEYRIDECRVTRGEHIEYLWLSKETFSVFVAVNSSIKAGPLVFLLQMFVITESIMKRPVYIPHLSGNELKPPHRRFKTLPPYFVISATIPGAIIGTAQ